MSSKYSFDPAKIVLIPETRASQVSESQFEPDKQELLVYLKLVTMNQLSIHNAKHQIQDLYESEKGWLIFSSIENLRSYLHAKIDECFNEAAKTVSKNK